MPLGTMICISASPTLLIHASLAHLTSELITLDSIIHYPSLTFTTKLPTELLLLIRGHLLPLLTSHLITQSTSALQEYETSLQALLCDDCVSYNREIYGSDVWQWEGFNGACECGSSGSNGKERVETLDSAVPFHDDISVTSRRFKCRFNWKYDTPIITLDPKQFINSEHYLQHYLSRQTRRLSRNAVQSARKHQTRLVIDTARVADIWELVSLVLGEHYGCKVFFNSEFTTQGTKKLVEDPTWTQEGGCTIVTVEDMQGRPYHDKTTAGTLKLMSSAFGKYYHTNPVYITSLSPGSQHQTSSDEDILLSDDTGGINQNQNHDNNLNPNADPDYYWTNRAILCRTWRDLGLGIDYSEFESRSRSSSLLPPENSTGKQSETGKAQDAIITGDKCRDIDSGSAIGGGDGGGSRQSGELTRSLLTSASTSSVDMHIRNSNQATANARSSSPPSLHSLFTHYKFLTTILSNWKWVDVNLNFQSATYCTTLFSTFIRVLTTVVTTCLSLPLAFASLALTIVCFYSRPKSFRIL